MIRPNKSWKEIVRVTVTGASTVFFSTFVSCAFAVMIEGAANQTLYHFFPHKYDDLEYAMGLNLEKMKRIRADEKKITYYNQSPSRF